MSGWFQTHRIELTLAIYATLLSTLLGLREIHEYLNTRPIFQAQCTDPIPLVSIDDAPARMSYSVRIWNAGPKPATVYRVMASISPGLPGSNDWTGKGGSENPKLPLRFDEGDMQTFSYTDVLERIDTPLIHEREYRGHCVVQIESTDGTHDLSHPVNIIYGYLTSPKPQPPRKN